MSTVDQLHASLVSKAEAEVRVAPTSLFWSALGAGLAIAFSFLAAAAAAAAAPPDWSALAGSMAYPLGFLIVVGGRYQLFTENTLPPVARVLERLDSVPSLLKLWGIVLFGNVVGAAAIGMVIAIPGVLPEHVSEAAAGLLTLTHHTGMLAVFGRAVLAGWLVAAMVWLLHRMSAKATLPVVWACTFVMPLLSLEHVVVGSVEATWAVGAGLVAPASALRHLGVTLVGNTVGGVLLVALLNHARTGTPDPDLPRLSLRHWLLGGAPPDGVCEPHVGAMDRRPWSA
ncbi:MAG: formate/nitrite transporter family protein [Myxococcota bacterium]